jgi:hypothetical protein
MSDPMRPTRELMDADCEALFDAERRAKAPAMELDRVWNRLAAPPVASADLSKSTSTWGRGWLASHAAGVATAAFVAGGVAGATAFAALQNPPPPRLLYVDRLVVVPSGTSSPPASPLPSPSATDDEPTAAPVPRASLPSGAPSSTPSPLAAERALLDEARAKLAASDPAVALALLDDHARRFRKPQLAEEREAIAVQALVALGRDDDARARGAKFLSTAPHSLFAPVVEGALRGIQ